MRWWEGGGREGGGEVRKGPPVIKTTLSPLCRCLFLLVDFLWLFCNNFDVRLCMFGQCVWPMRRVLLLARRRRLF